MPKPFANSPQYLNNISDDFIVPIQTGNATDDAGLPQMKYIKFSQLNGYIRSNLSTLGTFRGACTTEVPDNLAVNDFFYCKTSFTSGDDSFVAGHYYQYDINGNWVEITLAFDGLLTEADVIDNLTTQASDKPLSAKQGKVLNDAVTDISDDVTALTTRVANIEETLMGENEITVQYPNDSTYPSLMPNRAPLRTVKFAEVPRLRGKTRAWNQLSNAGQVITNSTTDTRDTLVLFWRQNSSPYTLLVATGISTQQIATASFSGMTDLIHNGSMVNINFANPFVSVVEGHKYLFCVDVASDDPTTVGGIELDNLIVRDLTLIFGAGNEPSTVAEALAALPDLGKYDAYDSGSLVSTEVSGVKSVGVNLWDEVKNEGKTIGDTGTAIIMYASSGSFCPTNQIPCKPNTTYKFIYSNPQSVTKPWLFELASEGTDSWSGFTIAQYVDSGYSFTTSANAKYITFACFDGITNIQLCDNSLPDAIKTTYHPYKTDTLSLPSTVTLKSAGSVSDELDVESGVITRKISSVDLGTLNWSYEIGVNRARTYDLVSIIKIPATGYSLGNYLSANGYTQLYASGTLSAEGQYAVLQDGQLIFYYNGTAPSGLFAYELATPTTESIDPITDNFIEVEGGGTVDNIQEQSPVLDNCLDVTYDIIPQ